MIAELAHAVSVEVVEFEAAAGEFETVEIGGVELFEGADKGLHIKFGVGLVLTEVGEADFDFVAEFGGLFFGLGDAGFVALGEFGGLCFPAAAGGRAEESAEGFDEPDPIEVAAWEEFAAGFDLTDPLVGGLFVPIVGDGSGEDLDPEFFGVVRVELGEGAGDAGERVDFEGVEGFDGESFVFGEGELGGVDDGVFGAVVGVVLGHSVDLDGGILGVNLTFDEALEDFGDPDIEADLAAGGDDFEAEVFLDAARAFQLGFVAEDAVEAGEELFSGELLFVVGAGDF